MTTIPWQSGLLPGRANKLLLGAYYDTPIRIVHITDDGPDATPGERYWAEFYDTEEELQACMAETLEELLAAIGEGVHWNDATTDEPLPDGSK